MPIFTYPGKLAEKNIKLTYFDAAGRAEAIRQTLFYGGVAFKDIRLTGAQWANLRPSTPYGQLPLLEVEGKNLAQSYAQLIYAGQLAGLYPEDAFHRAQVNELLFLGEDITTKLGPSFREQDPAKKKYLREKFVEELPQYIGYLERAVNENGSGKFLVGNSLSIADIATAVLVNWLFGGAVDHVPAGILDKFPKLKEFVNSVNATPKLAEFKKAFEENQKNAKPTIKLTYFDSPGRAEAIRYAFLIGDIEFEDERLNYQQWGERKANAPFGQLPLLDVDGKILTQSLAQLIYAGTLTGTLYPEDALKRAKINTALFAIDDFFGKATAAFTASTDEEKKATREKFAEDIQPLLASVDKLLGDKEYIAGELSIADLGLTQMMKFFTTRINYVPETVLDKFPNLKTWITRVDAHPKLAAYHKSQEGKPIFKF